MHMTESMSVHNSDDGCDTVQSDVSGVGYDTGEDVINYTSNNTNISMLEEEENYPEPETLQEELNEILEAFFELVPEEDIRAYQRYVEDIQGAKIAEQALQEPAVAPDFVLKDQDDETVHLAELLKKGPVILAFYRGKWCPHCNATLMRFQKQLVPLLQAQHPNASLVAISPMLPDGTLFLASKRDLNYQVCSDPQNAVADQFRIAFTISEHTRPFMTKWGEHLPTHNGSSADEWKIPLPATYVIGQDGRIAWSFLDNDPGVRAECEDILDALTLAEMFHKAPDDEEEGKRKRSSSRKSIRKSFNRKLGYVFLFSSKNTKKNLDLRSSTTSDSSGGAESCFELGSQYENEDEDEGALAMSDSKSVSSAKTSPAAFGEETTSSSPHTNNKQRRKTKSRSSLRASLSPQDFLGKYLNLG